MEAQEQSTKRKRWEDQRARLRVPQSLAPSHYIRGEVWVGCPPHLLSLGSFPPGPVSPWLPRSRDITQSPASIPSRPPSPSLPLPLPPPLLISHLTLPSQGTKQLV